MYVCTTIILINSSECGVPAAQNLTALIHGGRQAQFGEFPWHAAVYDIKQKDKNLICVGTIISPYILLSGILSDRHRWT